MENKKSNEAVNSANGMMENKPLHEKKSETSPNSTENLGPEAETSPINETVQKRNIIPNEYEGNESPILDIKKEKVLVEPTNGTLASVVNKDVVEDDNGDNSQATCRMKESVELGSPGSVGPTSVPNEQTQDIIIVDVQTTELDLNHGRIGKIENLEPLQNLERLYLRWNLIKRIEGLSTLNTLVELELYDNQITVIENLDALVNLEILDLSFNRIKEIDGLDNLLNLKKLFLSSNKISEIKKLNHLSKLELLELGDNRIREIKNLGGLNNLKQLYLGKNKISKIQNLEVVHALELLVLQMNRLTKIENLEQLTNLEQLYLSENAITVIENLEHQRHLTTLDLSKNRITVIQNVRHMSDLEEFWLNDNQITGWESVEYLQGNQKLSTIYLERNPLARDPAYRFKLKLNLPSLQQIDATLCR